MPEYVLDVETLYSGSEMSVTGAASVAAATSDESDATYARPLSGYGVSHVYNVSAPASPSGRFCCVVPRARYTKPSTYPHVVYVAGKVDSSGGYVTVGNVPLATVATITDLAATAADGFDPELSWASYTTMPDGLLVGFNVNSTLESGRPTFYEAGLRAFYLLPVTVTTLSAPSGTASQTPTLTAPLSLTVEAWQLEPSSPFLCGGDVEYRVYHAADAPGSTPPAGVTPAWSGFERFTETTLGARTPSVTTECGALENGDYVLFARASRDLMSGARLYWSSWQKATWTQNVPLPATPALALAAQDATQRVALTVTASATTGYESDSAILEIERYAGGAWRAVRGVDGAAIAIGAAELAGYDYEADRAATNTYRARVSMWHTADAVRRSSAWDQETVTGPAYLANAWNLKTVEDPASSWIGAPVSTGPGEESQAQTALFTPLDGTRPIVVSGTVAGMAGALELEASGSAEIATLEALLAYRGVVLLEDAFGGAKYVRLTKGSWQRLGTREAPRRLAAVSYAEVGHGLEESAT